MKNIWVLIVVILLPACAGQSNSGGDIIVDKKNTDMQAYYQDLHECRNYAAQVNTGAKVVGGAVTGAVVGGAVGAIVGNSDSAKRAAGAGGLLGGLRGAGRSHQEKHHVVKNCLRGRGYRVLN